MSVATSEMARGQGPAVRLDMRHADMAMLGLAMLWMAEATVRLPGGAALTALIYGYFGIRLAGLLIAGEVPVRPVLALLPFPLVCLASAMWSPVPQHSLIATIQLIFTFTLAFWAGWRMPMGVLAWILAVALSVSFAASAGNLGGALPPAWSWEGGFLGIYTNKNALGQRAALALLTAVCLALANRGGLRLAALVMAALAAWMLALSLSVTGQVLGAGMAFAAIGLHLAGRRSRTAAIVTVLVIGLVAAVAFTVVYLGLDPVGLALERAGKSHTLTGRTLLWEIALDKVAQDPLTGQGYMGYWAADANRQETAVIAVLYGATVASFHNFALEVLVMTGVPGLVSLLATLLVMARWIMRAPTGAGRTWAGLVVALVLVLSLLGSSLYRPHEISLFLVVALGVAARRSLSD